jgi:hypothetical protein
MYDIFKITVVAEAMIAPLLLWNDPRKELEVQLLIT